MSPLCSRSVHILLSRACDVECPASDSSASGDARVLVVADAQRNQENFKNVGGGSEQLPVTNNVKTWGWVVLILGAVLILSGFLIFVGNLFGRVIGVLAAGVNAIVQLAYLPHYPLWSFTMILVDILVIWGIVVHGGRLLDRA